jgi:D-alanyl-D-alanine carboxypeptidase/D-alanyl-D-alanine-endopeptidase (penicillin-binding protein 4)
MIPFAREKIMALGEKSGRYAFSHDRRQALLYAGHLFSFFLEKKGILREGSIRPGVHKPQDRLICTYSSKFTLEDVIKEMLAFSNNFVANQLLLSAGAAVYGAPATLQKGVRTLLDYARKDLGLQDLELAEGSGISRKNRISPEDMLKVLHRFRPYRDLLPREGPFLYKTGTLKGIRTRAGYIEKGNDKTGYIVLFPDAGDLMRCLERLF